MVLDRVHGNVHHGWSWVMMVMGRGYVGSSWSVMDHGVTRQRLCGIMMWKSWVMVLDRG